jgi:hypothetical protein
MFIATDDEQALTYAKEHSDWTVLHTDIVPRGSGSHKHVSIDKRFQDYGIMEIVNSFVSLKYLLLCRAWIATHTSNYSRLILELAMTVAGKADALYIDVDPQTCKNHKWCTRDFLVDRTSNWRL